MLMQHTETALLTASPSLFLVNQLMDDENPCTVNQVCIDMNGKASVSASYTQNITTAPDSDSGTNKISTGSQQSIPEGLTPVDIICARDKQAHQHPGNQKYQAIVRSQREIYQHSKYRDGKGRTTRSVIAKVEAYGGRFMKYDNKSKTWTALDREAEKEKVAHALRSSKGCVGPKTSRRKHGDNDEASLDTGVYSRQLKVFKKMKGQEETEDDNESKALIQASSIQESSFDYESQSPTTGGQNKDDFEPLDLSCACLSAEDDVMKELIDWATGKLS
jgi:hypothetical protein